MITVAVDNDFESWRTAARSLIAAKVEPQQIVWQSGDQPVFFAAAELPKAVVPSFNISSKLLNAMRLAASHSSTEKWPRLYSLLYRTVFEQPELFEIVSDPDVRAVTLMGNAVRRDIHKTHAFVRFRKLNTDDGETYMAWHEPHHFTVELAAPFFVRRFGSMRFSILTPKGCAHWDTNELIFSAGVERVHLPDDDAEDHWLAYYGAIFNPFRLKINAMKREMPVRHWRTLPEAVLIDPLIKDSRSVLSRTQPKQPLLKERR